ncbi:MAG: hypothetical protein VSS52_011860, partial [Thiotrichaceae bacterium]|nr:hypothetical protein [Thiotrichaceae bacterium]
MNILQDLEQLQSFCQLSIVEIEQLQTELGTPALQSYLRTMQFPVKPEAASSDLFKAILPMITSSNVDIYSEVRQKEGGYIDFRLQEQKSNPVLLELKPMFVQVKDKDGTITGIKYKALDYPLYRDQIRKYLVDNDYLILTNLCEVQLFNRDVLALKDQDFKPFRKLTFIGFLNQYEQIQNFWQVIRRLDSQVKIGLEKDFFEDLARWYDELVQIEFIEDTDLSKEELIVLLLNKVIFIKTLEDYGLIDFNFFKDS